MECRSRFMAFSKGARGSYKPRDERKGWVWRRCGSSGLPVAIKKAEPDPVPNWAKLLDEVLAQIFERLPLPDRAQVVPLVCKSWNKVSCDPNSWRRIDMVPWIQHQIDAECRWEYDMEDSVDYLVKKLVVRSGGQLRELHTMYISDAAVDYLAERCPLLEVLTMPSSLGVTDSSALKLARAARRLRHLDVSDCYNISKEAISAFGDNCPSLEWLSRSMINQNSVNESESSSSPPGGDEEAIVMSEHYPKLKRLEMKKTKISDRGLRRLVIGCPNLQQLDFSCCYQLTSGALDDVSKNCSNLEITKPITPRMHVTPTDPHCTMLFE